MLTLVKLSETASTLTLGWAPTGTMGYVFYADGKRVSWTNDPTRKQVTFKKGAAEYKVVALATADEGIYPPPGTPSPLLTWRPAVLTSPITVNVPSSGVVPVYGQQPWVIQLPDRDVILNLGHRREVASGYAGLSIHGGRNISVIGGEIEVALATSVQGDGQRDALTFIGQTGLVHVEGVKFSGNPLRLFVVRAPDALFQFQNCRGGVRMGWKGSYATTDHSDIILDQEQPQEERFDLCTFEYDNTGAAFYGSGGGRRILKRTNFRNRADNPTGHDFVHRDVKAMRLEFYDFWTETGFGFDGQGKPTQQQFTLTNAWLFSQPQMTLSGDGKSSGSYVTFPNPAGDNVAGGIWYGVPPGGDFNPEERPGVGYVTPGYL